jgi:hypothetical protein
MGFSTVRGIKSHQRDSRNSSRRIKAMTRRMMLRRAKTQTNQKRKKLRAMTRRRKIYRRKRTLKLKVKLKSLLKMKETKCSNFCLTKITIQSQKDGWVFLQV